MAGYVAENVLRGRMEVVLPRDINNIDFKRVQLVDVRTGEEYQNGHIEGAVHIPVDSIRERISEFSKDKEIWLYCKIGLRGYIATSILSQKGYKVKNLTGGYESFKMANFKPSGILTTDTGADSSIPEEKTNYTRFLDACGLCCPGPLMQVKKRIDDMAAGEILKITASDPGFYEDIKAWCQRTNNELVELNKQGAIITAYIKKTRADLVSAAPEMTQVRDNKTLVVFSGDLDKALASFIIANGAAAMGKKVTMFFTFWGLNIVRKHNQPAVEKGFMDKMFGMMMPRGSRKLKLSKMNMMGLGTMMMKAVMKNKNVPSLEELIEAAIESGIELVACQMSMDVMGLKPEELLPGVKIGGVGYYLGEAEDSNLNLFI
ncbi:MAG: Thiosulfate sulfurtransferase PspE precursor [Pelotomaculum sp. PtaU1.Bin035]|nr:MAG: Thiosulfate sulfurtransferase PspE precursor [Pelotomaculum sp. PtaU1.Bin035]